MPEGERESFETGRALADAYLRRTDLRDGIAFDPSDDDGEDHTAAYGDVPRRRTLPPAFAFWDEAEAAFARGWLIAGV